MKKVYNRPCITIDSIEVETNLLTESPANATIGIGGRRPGGPGRAEVRERSSFECEEEWGDMW